METTQVPLDQGIIKENVLYLQNGLLFSFIKNEILPYGTGGHYVK
jgi:hypothetical protein